MSTIIIRGVLFCLGHDASNIWVDDCHAAALTASVGTCGLLLVVGFVWIGLWVPSFLKSPRVLRFMIKKYSNLEELMYICVYRYVYVLVSLKGKGWKSSDTGCTNIWDI